MFFAGERATGEDIARLDKIDAMDVVYDLDKRRAVPLHRDMVRAFEADAAYRATRAGDKGAPCAAG